MEQISVVLRCPPGHIFFFPQSKTLPSRWAGLQMGSRDCGVGVNDIIWATCLCWFGLDLSGHYFLIVECEKGEDDPRKWRKIGDSGEDLWGISTCRAEIGNWAVVIIGYRIDVVPINQNCWINKKIVQGFCAMAVSKICQNYALALPPFIVFQYLQQRSRENPLLLIYTICFSLHIEVLPHLDRLVLWTLLRYIQM